jgi:signal transduction histidine kinase
MRRLFLQVYLAFLGILMLFGLLVALAWWIASRAGGEQQALDGAAALVSELLDTRLTGESQEARLRRLAETTELDVTLWDAAGRPLAEVGPRLPFPGGRRQGSGWMPGRHGPMGVLRLSDGRWLVARHRHTRARYHGIGLLLIFALLAMAVAVGAWPLARRLTRRLERLRAGVEGLGGGDLKARVPVEGRDEVADLARSFNRAADRIQALVGAQRTLLASASHELRTPLTRIRMALELGAQDPERRVQVAADIAELDELIEELLLASRLESAPERGPAEDVDLLGLVVEEAARFEAEVSGRPVPVRGETRLLRRLVRNLLENARRHGAGTAIEATVEERGGRAVVRVCDRGPGVPSDQAERIFDAFYRLPGADASSGAGLGLALVRQIARRHGGEARYRPREGGGSCFEVELPAPAAARAAAG